VHTSLLSRNPLLSVPTAHTLFSSQQSFLFLPAHSRNLGGPSFAAFSHFGTHPFRNQSSAAGRDGAVQSTRAAWSTSTARGSKGAIPPQGRSHPSAGMHMTCPASPASLEMTCPHTAIMQMTCILHQQAAVRNDMSTRSQHAMDLYPAALRNDQSFMHQNASSRSRCTNRSAATQSIEISF